jgi:hypothetical protein
MIHQVIMSAPLSLEETKSEEWRKKSLCYKLMGEAHTKDLDKWVGVDLDSTVAFWLREYPSLAEKTRSSILSTLTTMMDNFLRRPFRQLFSELPPDRRQIAKPELTHKGAIVIMNLPV